MHLSTSAEGDFEGIRARYGPTTWSPWRGKDGQDGKNTVTKVELPEDDREIVEIRGEDVSQSIEI